MIGTAHRRPAETAETAEHTTGELVRQASEQLSELVRREMRLGQKEMARKGKRAGLGGGLYGGAGIFAVIALQAMAAAAIGAFYFILPFWAAALVVAGALLIVAAILALVGRKQMSRATPATPEATVRSVKADVAEIKGRAHR